MKAVKIEPKHVTAMAQHLTPEQMAAVLNGIDTGTALDCLPRKMDPAARIMLYWILDSSGVNPYEMPETAEID